MTIVFLVGVLIGSGLGYGLRGAIGREIKAITADLKADLARVEAAVKSKV